MDKEMGRLILVPQYPIPMRYQHWWHVHFKREYLKHFQGVLILGEYFILTHEMKNRTNEEQFSVMDLSVKLELAQIKEFLNLELREDDVLLLCDLSFPGLFANVLIHKKPNKCFAICHATSKNRYDYFYNIREIKYPIEKGIAKLFDGIFVATQYHKEKLGWDNIHVIKFPHLEPAGYLTPSINEVVCVSRPGIQKRTKSIERFLRKNGIKITSPPKFNLWEDYFKFLASSKVLLITSKEETYGYQVLDALYQGCVPVAPRAYSYPELLPNELLYDSKEECLSIINSILNGNLKINALELYKNLSNEFNNFFSKTSDIMKVG